MPDKVDLQTELSLFSVLERGETVSQIALSKRLSVSVGLVNALLKRIMQKGLAKARAVPSRRWVYYLTPKGFVEKSRLVATYLEMSLAFFREAREEYAALFAAVRAAGTARIVLVGRGELAEIALLAAREGNMEIVGLLDPQANVERLLGLPVLRRPDEAGTSAVFVITDSRHPQVAFDSVRAQCGPNSIVAPAFLHITPDVAFPSAADAAARVRG